MKLLIFDSNPDRFAPFRDELSKHEAIFIGNIHNAARRVAEHNFDLVVADWNSGGPRLIEMVYSQPGLHPPIALIDDEEPIKTRINPEAMQYLARRHRACAYIARPVGSNLLEPLLREILAETREPIGYDHIIRDIGGPEIFQEILQRHSISEGSPDWKRLEILLNYLGHSNPEVRMRVAGDLIVTVPSYPNDPVWQAMGNILHCYLPRRQPEPEPTS